MQTRLTKGVDLIVDTDDSGQLTLSATLSGAIVVELQTKCCTCSSVLSVQFEIDRPISVEESWKSEPVRCPNCRIKQLRKIRYHIQARKEGLDE